MRSSSLTSSPRATDQYPAGEPAPAICLKNLYKVYDSVVAVNNISLEVPQGEIFGVIGPNGAGKTTTLRMILGITPPTSGELSVLDSSDIASVRHRLGYLPEEKGFYKNLKVREHVVYMAKLKGMDKKLADEKARELLKTYGLGDWIEKKCGALSKGMGQKVQVIATLLHDPELVVLDEPFSGLDPVNTDFVRDNILEFRDRGHTIMFSTHIMDQAEQLCDSLVLINKGTIVVEGSVSDILTEAGDAIRIEFDGDPKRLDEITGLEDIALRGRTAEIKLVEGTDPHGVLRQLMDKVEVRKYDRTQVSLHEVFVNAVGGDFTEEEPTSE